MQIADTATLPTAGRIKMTSDRRGVLHEKSNLVVDASVEVMLQALMGADLIDAVVFGDSGGASVTPGLRSVFNPIFRAAAGSTSSIQPVISKDSRALSSIGTWTAIYTNTGLTPVTYDMIGLVSQNTRLFAATSFATAITVDPGESVAVEWTVLLAGR